jgi:hypothetical protein
MKWLKRTALACSIVLPALAFAAFDFALVDACEAHYGSCGGFRALVTVADSWAAHERARFAAQGRDV